MPADRSTAARIATHRLGWRSGLCLGLVVWLSAMAVATEIKPGGTMVVALPGDPEVLNSSITTDISSSNLSGQIYGTLVRLDNDGKVEPYLAKSWEIAADGLTYTFRLFDDVKWHDGKPFTADDVAWGLWNVNRKYNGPASGLLAAVEAIEAVDRHTVVFRLKYPYPPLLRGLAYFNSSNILPKHIYDNGEDPRRNPANAKPIGTGPFVFKEYRKGSHLIFERNRDFHLKGQPYLDRLVFQIIPNEAARALALEKGDIDFIPYYATSLSEVERLKSNRKVVVAIAKRMIAGEYMAFLNTRNAPLDKKEVRQALYYALDREELLQKTGFGYGKVSAGPISSEQLMFYTDKGRAYPYDPARAEAMLDQAGYAKKPDGKRFTLRISFDQKEGPMNNAAKLMRVQFARIGVDVVIMGMDTGAWRDTAFRNWDYDVTMGSFSTGPDPAIGVERLYLCRTVERLMGRNISGYCNPTLDDIFNRAARESDEANRIALYHQATTILTEDVPHWWLWDRYYPIAFNANLVGLPADPTAYGPFDRVGWKK